MWWKILISFVVIIISGNFALADCPSADVTGDCFVDFEDFAVMAAQWLTTDPCVPDDMIYIHDGEFDMGDHHDGMSGALPVHAVFLDAFFIGKFTITNRQYCDYLNSAILAGDIKVVGGNVFDISDTGSSRPYCYTRNYSTYSQIDYSGGVFSVRTKGQPPRDMSNDPMVLVSWYGATVYCNWRSDQEGYETCYNLSTWDCDFSKKGYRLATEAEWEYAARGGLSGKRFPWADPNISHIQANYYSLWVDGSPYYPYDVSPTEGHHPDWNDVYPYTSEVGSFAANGYGLYDTAGNVFEWCNDRYVSTYYSTSPYDNPRGPASGSSRVLRGGSWFFDGPQVCRVAYRHRETPGDPGWGERGFRVVLNLE
jgi:formylglycine-generating enzyme required for sulfatase activity